MSFYKNMLAKTSNLGRNIFPIKSEVKMSMKEKIKFCFVSLRKQRFSFCTKGWK